MVGIINRLGTHIKLPDGRVGTVVYNSLVGVGIKWGLHNPDPEDFEGTSGGLFTSDVPIEDFPWKPDVLLRDSSMTKRLGMECVCEEKNVEVLKVGKGI